MEESKRQPDPGTVEQSVARALRDSLPLVQHTAKELEHAIEDLVSACGSRRPSNTLSAMLRAHTAASSLSAMLDTIMRLVTLASQPPRLSPAEEAVLRAVVIPAAEPAPMPPKPTREIPTPMAAAAPSVEEAPPPVGVEPSAPPEAPAARFEVEAEAAWVSESPAPEPSPMAPAAEVPTPPPAYGPAPEAVVEESYAPASPEVVVSTSLEMVAESATVETAYATEPLVEPPAVEASPAVETGLPLSETALPPGVHVAPEAVPVAEPALPEAPEVPAFDLGSLPANLQELHRRANRVAKVSMQDIRMLRPKEVHLGRQKKDLCARLRNDLDKARKEYVRRFQPILDHPVDYFHHWMVEILAEGNPEALGEYPYPSPVPRR